MDQKNFSPVLELRGPLGGSRHRDPPSNYAELGLEHEEYASLEEK
jgi:hypothetical protein